MPRSGQILQAGLAVVSLASGFVYALAVDSCAGAASGWGWIATIAGTLAMLLGLISLARGRSTKIRLVSVVVMLAGGAGLLLAALNGYC